MVEARYDHVCGVVGHKEVLIAGGTDAFENPLDTAEFFSLSNMEWREGPRMPEKITGADSIEYGSSYIVMGGFSNNDGVSNVHQFIEGKNAWIKRKETLSRKRAGHVLFTIKGMTLEQCTQIVQDVNFFSIKAEKMVFSSWSPWVYINGSCPQKCGPEGPMNQDRICLKDNGECIGSSQRRRNCNMEECSEFFNIFQFW